MAQLHVKFAFVFWHHSHKLHYVWVGFSGDIKKAISLKASLLINQAPFPFSLPTIRIFLLMIANLAKTSAKRIQSCDINRQIKTKQNNLLLIGHNLLP